MERQKLGLQGRLAAFIRAVEHRFPGAPDKSQTIRSEVLNPITNGLKDPKDCLPIVQTCLRKAKELVQDFEDIATTFVGGTTNHSQQLPPSEDRLLDSRPDPNAASSALQLYSRHMVAEIQRAEIQRAEIQSSFPLPVAGPSAPSHASKNDADQSPDAQQLQDDGHRDDIQNLLVLSEVDIPPHLRKQTPTQMSCTLMEHQKIGLTWLIEQEMDPKKKGGLLADTMGLGKTVQALSLIIAHPSRDPKRKTTLIVAPLALLRQWEKEISTKVKPQYKLKTVVFHGPECKYQTASQLLEYDVVLCTYAKLQTEYKNKFELKKPENVKILASKAKFYRVILDEAHNIRNQPTYASKAAAEIASTYRLCMTGTPFMNRAEEIFALIRFLNISPYNKWERFSEDILSPLRKWDGDAKEHGMIKLQALFRSFTLRRTKESRLDGKPIIELPPRTDKPAFFEFNNEQRAFYEALELQQQLKFNKYLKDGAVMKNYIHIFVLLLRLRQACDHPFLLKNRGIPEGAKLDEKQMIRLACELPSDIVERLRRQKKFECLLCSDATVNPIIVYPCGHNICANCFTASVAVGEPELFDDDRMEDGDSPKEKSGVPCPGENCEHRITPTNIVCYSFLNDVPGFDSGADDNAMGEVHTIHDERDEDETAGSGNLGRFNMGSEGEIIYIGDSSDEEEDEEDFDSANDDDEGNEIEGEIDGYGQSSYFDEPGLPQVDGGAYDDLAREPANRTPKRKSRANKARAHSRKRSRKVTETSGGRKKGKDKAKSLSLADQRQAAQRSAIAMSRYKERLRKEWISSAKIDAIMEILEGIRPKEEKTLIFSLWPSFLDLVEIPIERARIKFTRYDGSMTPGAREAAVKSFMEDAGVRVMLVSLTAGNAGLNLTAASQVIVAEPFWNPYVEEQAIDRAHRFGQRRPVTVHRLLIQGTVEDRIVALQEHKKMLVDAALSEKGAKSISKLNVAELRSLFGLGPGS
ncbi:hypothetical protein Daus18300_003994 [Diaporthe australafricana]|uniref:Uncharacterized protein n=1 Tax=Diaporthe australafricana TaxID=127596 RepID=A0ABR3XB49_9PEZI